ncbi:MAG: PilZ domain-containing protein, partial [Candidatus Sulfotelmatobacter sp.]
MHAASTSTRRARAQHRQNLHTLTYVTLDEANGGIVRNLNHEGAAIQAVGALRLHQRVRVRFELRHPRVKVDSMGEVVWAEASGQCGVRFLDLSSEVVRQINEWILGDLLDSVPSRSHSIFGGALDAHTQDDGLLLSQEARKVIQLQPERAGAQPVSLAKIDENIDETNLGETDINETIDTEADLGAFARTRPELDWLSRPISGRQMAWTLNSLIVFAALLLFSLVFLAVTQDLPRWPVDLEAGFAAAIFVTAFYWIFFRFLGGASLGARLARLAESDAG